MLTRYEQNGLELLIDQQTGETFASISAVSRMTDKAKSTVSRYVNGELEGVAPLTLFETQIHTAGGLQDVALLNENQILEVISKYKPALLINFAQAGLRVYLHQLAGYQITSTAIEQPKLPQNYLEALEALVSCEKERLVLQAQIIDDAPYVNFAKMVECSPLAVTNADMAKSIKWGRNTFIKKLRELKIYVSHGKPLPYQQYLDQGLFLVHTNKEGERSARITPKGQIWVAKKLGIAMILGEKKNDTIQTKLEF